MSTVSYFGPWGKLQRLEAEDTVELLIKNWKQFNSMILWERDFKWWSSINLTFGVLISKTLALHQQPLSSKTFGLRSSSLSVKYPGLLLQDCPFFRNVSLHIWSGLVFPTVCLLNICINTDQLEPLGQNLWRQDSKISNFHELPRGLSIILSWQLLALKPVWVRTTSSRRTESLFLKALWP